MPAIVDVDEGLDDHYIWPNAEVRDRAINQAINRAMEAMKPKLEEQVTKCIVAAIMDQQKLVKEQEAKAKKILTDLTEFMDSRVVKMKEEVGRVNAAIERNNQQDLSQRIDSLEAQINILNQTGTGQHEMALQAIGKMLLIFKRIMDSIRVDPAMSSIYTEEPKRIIVAHLAKEKIAERLSELAYLADNAVSAMNITNEY